MNEPLNLTKSEAAVPELRYHVPRSQVWGGSRGGQSGNLHLHLTADLDSGRLKRRKGQALCGKYGWYERPAEGETRDYLCARCLDMAARHGVPVPDPDEDGKYR